MAEVIDIEELRRIGATLRRMQADQGTLLSRFDGVERRLAIIEERQAEVEASVRALGQDVALLDRKLDVVVALVRDDVAGLERRMEARFSEIDRKFDAIDRKFEAIDRKFEAMDRKFDAVLAAIAALRPPTGG